MSIQEFFESRKTDTELTLRGSSVFMFIHKDLFKKEYISKLTLSACKMDDLDAFELTINGFFTPASMMKPYLLVSNQRDKDLIDLLSTKFNVKIKEVYDALPEHIQKLYVDFNPKDKTRDEILVQEVKMVAEMLLIINSGETSYEKTIKTINAMIHYLKTTTILLDSKGVSHIKMKQSMLVAFFRNKNHITEKDFSYFVDRFVL